MEKRVLECIEAFLCHSSFHMGYLGGGVDVVLDLEERLGSYLSSISKNDFSNFIFHSGVTDGLSWQ